jgi:hypothetical protein
MTIAVAWVRKLRDVEELVFVSDSRLTGDGRVLDVCPKIFMLPRADCAICFAGYTGNAYPLMHHLAFAIDAHRGLATRAMDITKLKPRLLNVFSDTINAIETPLPELQDPDIGFLFGGYSWIYRSFRLWVVTFDSTRRTFLALDARNVQTNHLAKRVFYGDADNAGAVKNVSLGRMLTAGVNSTVVAGENLTVGSTVWLPAERLAPGR